MPENPPLVSVIIPNYNYARYLPERIESVLGQTFQDFEIILLDDFSTDNSREVIGQYRSHPKVADILYNDTNSGSPFLQWQKGISRARGKYIWIAEADDLALPHFLEYTVKALNDNPKAVLAMTLASLINADGEVFDEKGLDVFDPDDTIKYFDGITFDINVMVMLNRVYNASGVLFTKEAFTSNTDQSYLSFPHCGDWVLWANLIARGDMAVVCQKLNRFRKHGTSVSDDTILTTFPESMDVRRKLFRQFATADQYRTMLYRTYRDGKKTFPKEVFPLAGISPQRQWLRWLYKHSAHLLLDKIDRLSNKPAVEVSPTPYLTIPLS